MRNMKRFRSTAAGLASCALLGIAGCAAMEWRSAPREPAIKALQGAQSLGVFSFTPELSPFGRFLIKTEKHYYMAISVSWMKQKIALVYLSPEAMTDFSVNAEALAALSSAVTAREIGNADGFDYSVWKSGVNSRLLGAPLLEPSAEESGQTRGFDSVVAIGESFTRGSATPERIKGLGEKYGVDFLLGIKPAFIAEIGLVTDQRSTWDYGKEVPIGNFILMTQISLEYVLYDAGTGAKVTDSSATLPQFSTIVDPMDNITDLGIKDMDELNAFLSGTGYIAKFEEPFKKALAPYLSLFRPLHVATLQEVKKK
jgi:hypothetical protein